jgi:general nucleoside transport system ATP-binding protein
MGAMTAEAPPAFELRGLAKQFGSVLANEGVNLRVAAGTIHGIIGENGAGKSTTMKLLYGLLRPDAGEIFVSGKSCVWKSPADAIARGIGMVHQHFMLAGPYSALDNILLGAEPFHWRMIDRKGARARLAALARQYGLPVDWECPVEQLSVGIQQRVEILKLLYREASILILDEPTAVLTPHETNELFANLRKLRAEGKTVLLVTHKLKDVMSFTDRVTVFRAGKVTGEVETVRTNPQELANLMVGRKVMLNIAVPPAHPRPECALEAKGLSLAGPAGSRPRLSNISFSVRCGEIVGIAGVDGNGQSELLQGLLHPRDPQCRTSGSVHFLGEDVTGWTPYRIRDLGVAVIPEDRLQEGLLLDRPVSENFLLGLQRSPAFGRAGFLDLRSLARAASSAAADYDVRPPDLNLPAGKLSGGNQQKLIVAREFQRQPRLLIAAQPTRGVDVGATEFIHIRIVRARNEGAGVLLVSSELDEILNLSDRILVMFEGRIAAEFRRGEVTERELGLKMGGA